MLFNVEKFLGTIKIAILLTLKSLTKSIAKLSEYRDIPKSKIVPTRLCLCQRPSHESISTSSIVVNSNNSENDSVKTWSSVPSVIHLQLHPQQQPLRPTVSPKYNFTRFTLLVPLFSRLRQPFTAHFTLELKCKRVYRVRYQWAT